MEPVLDWLARGFDELVGRASGPFHTRLLIMPTVVTILAIRAGLRDARQGQPAFLWTVLTSPAERRRLFRSALRDIGRVFVMAAVLDTAYQVWVLRAWHPGQVLIVAVGLAVMPYVIVRGPVTRVARFLNRRRVKKS